MPSDEQTNTRSDAGNKKPTNERPLLITIDLSLAHNIADLVWQRDVYKLNIA